MIITKELLGELRATVPLTTAVLHTASSLNLTVDRNTTHEPVQGAWCICHKVISRLSEAGTDGISFNYLFSLQEPEAVKSADDMLISVCHYPPASPHFLPLNPARHLHLKSPSLYKAIQVPPFWHGFSEQGLCKTNKKKQIRPRLSYQPVSVVK